MTGILRCFQTNKTGRKNPWPIIFAFGCTALSLILLLVGIANSHRMGKSEQQAVTALERLVVGIGEDGTVRLVTATLDDQVRSVNRYPLESGVTDLPDSLPVTEQTRIRYPWAVAVSQGKLFVFDLRSIVAETHLVKRSAIVKNCILPMWMEKPPRSPSWISRMASLQYRLKRDSKANCRIAIQVCCDIGRHTLSSGKARGRRAIPHTMLDR